MRMILSHARVGCLASVRISEGVTIFEQEVEKLEEGKFTMQKVSASPEYMKIARLCLGRMSICS